MNDTPTLPGFATFVAAYRAAEVKAARHDAAWPGTRFVRPMFAAVPFPISLAMACQLAYEYKQQASALYWGEKTNKMVIAR